MIEIDGDEPLKGEEFVFWNEHMQYWLGLIKNSDVDIHPSDKPVIGIADKDLILCVYIPIDDIQVGLVEKEEIEDNLATIAALERLIDRIKIQAGLD